MFLARWQFGRSLAIALSSVLALLSGCGPSRYAYFQPQRNAPHHQAPALADLTASADTLPDQASPISLRTDKPTALKEVAEPAAPVRQMSAVASQASTHSTRHSNPDSYPTRRINTWFSKIPVAHVAPRTHTIDRNSTNRKTHPLALVALGLSVLAYAPLLLAATGTAMWVLSVTLPLAAILLGVASVTTIKRNKDRYRGKGWAMAAIVLGTGVLGLALVAIAALSLSNLVWEK
ncbi:DUF4190 domain-containing protein [Spirosoma soli]|uniref:DUF4190 domain-containing protein n=1 Tax=Spirosoma soli TaxID=1770529 RepID=A0ABW5M3X9_9BACT